VGLLFENMWEKIQRGDLKTFEKLYKRLYPELCFYANKIVKDKFISEVILVRVRRTP